MKRRGFVIPIILMLIPVIVLTVFTLVQMAVHENGFSLHSAARERLFFMSESGINLAWFAFQASAFAQVTHAPDGVSLPPANAQLQMASANLAPPFAGYLHVRVAAPDAGWYEWQWSPGNPVADSLTASGLPETIRFQVYYPQPGQFKIVSKAMLGNQSTVHTVQGVSYSPFQYAVFANGNWALEPGNNVLSVTGQVQVNGDLYLAPSQWAGLALTGNLMAASGNIYRYVDIDGNADNGGEVTFAHQSPPSAPAIVQGFADGVSGQGNEYDSFNPNWPTQGANGAIQRFGGGLIDGTLGGQSVQPPSQSMAPGGYYDTLAGLHISYGTAAPWASAVSFPNLGEGVTVQAMRIDLSHMPPPANGVIYSNVPLLLDNGETLPAPLTIVSDCGIYVHGGYNRDLPTAPHKPAALMTTDRVVLLSDAFDPATVSLTVPGHMTRSLYAGDPNPVQQILEINAALVDGCPPESGARFVASWAGMVNPAFGSGNLGGCTDETIHNEGDMSSMTVRLTGSSIHLENATMALFDNSNVANGITGWFINKAYGQPPTRQFAWDPSLATSPVPGQPLVGLKLMWQIGP